MTMTATIYARAAFDPRQHTTKTGKPMTTCRVAVDVTGRDGEEPQTWWVDLMAFGQHAETLARVEKGQMISAMGRCTRGTYTTKDGTERESWTLLADAILTARSGRPGQRRQASASHRSSSDDQPPDFDDPINF